jgi:hypothetical protein
MTSSTLIGLYFWLGVIGAHVTRMRRNLWWLAVMRLRSPRETREQCPENHGSGLLNGFQALAQETGVSVPKGYVIRRRTSGLKPDGLADDEGHSFGFGFAHLLGSQGAALTPVKEFMADLVRQRGKFLGGLHPGKQRDFSAVGQALGGSDLVGVVQRDTVGFHELDQPFAVAANIALYFGQRWEVFALRLAPIKNVHSPESAQRPLTVRCCVFTRLLGRYILRASFSDHRGENENAFFSPFNEAAKRVPSPKSGDVGSIGFLTCDEHDVAEAVGVKLRHCSEVGGEDFTVTGLQCCNEEIRGLFGSRVDFF